MLNEICKEITELIILFLIIFICLCCCDWANKESIHDQAVYESQFSMDFEVSEGFIAAMFTEPKS